MARLTMTQLRLNALAYFPSGDQRDVLTDFIDTVTPGYGILNLVTPPVVQGFTITPSIVTAYDQVFLASQPFTADAGTGLVTATQNIVVDVAFNASIEFVTNRDSLFQIYLNENPGPYATSHTGEGAGNPIFVLAGGILEVQPGDTISGRVTMDGGTTTDVTFLSLTFTCRAVPLIEDGTEQPPEALASMSGPRLLAVMPGGKTVPQSFPSKAQAGDKVYGFSWRPTIGSGVAITESTWRSVEGDLELTNPIFAGQETTVMIGSGNVDQIYTVENTIVTEAGETIVASAPLKVRRERF